ncbi:Nif3-like dinuclear metal center hexameric protein [Nitrosomonas halophila]|uniref:GTP cyclohydrolase 1 type 2 homolog n=1 Tax=Nitrosomonas halophila TaxID=44576 RepID=A0A1H3DLC1_9PROT|nr:Nif3-like dinuclear metal center hexameric protein [Nitrosomonas halophila]SDX67226.1 dinuclear metal center protein, YbgI/SA1388 family [Nitrosomonas halophila]
MQQNALEQYLNDLLNTCQFQDYCPNGLQVEGRAMVHTIVSGVTASQALLEAAVARQADAVLVHHGYFWRGEEMRLRGIKRHRLATLLKHNINLYAYHLPLDAHPELGNNAQLGMKLHITEDGCFGEQNLVRHGHLAERTSLQALNDTLERVLGRKPLTIGDASKPVKRIAWCTGAAQGYFEAAIALGVDAYITGEISEQNVHAARESGIAYIAAGHHATERYGVQALGEHLAHKFGIIHHFIDIDNPV